MQNQRNTVSSAGAEIMSQQFDGNSVFPRGEKNEAYAKYFTGDSYLTMLSMEGVVIGNVAFEPGCRNFWHIHHQGGQILLVTGGRGWYQAWNQPARELKTGDVVHIPAGMKHCTVPRVIAGLPISLWKSRQLAHRTSGLNR